MTNTSTMPDRRPLLEMPVWAWLAMLALIGTALAAGLWLLGVVLIPRTQPYCGNPDEPEGCFVDPSYWWWAVPPSAILALSVASLILLVNRCRKVTSPEH